MKRIITYILSAMMLLSLASCYKSSRIFDETAAQRTEDRIELCPVPPRGFEPLPKEPESLILSIRLWGHLLCKFMK